MPIFFHDQLLFGDEVAWAQYLQEHFYEHDQFVNIAAAQMPPIILPAYDLTSWRNTTDFARNWLLTHESVHEQLRQVAGVAGVNLADVDLGKESEFYIWIDAHRQEHRALRQAFGITT